MSMRSSCGCKSTSCKKRACTKNHRQCNERYQDALTTALANLMANQQQQQHMFQMQQQQMLQQQDVLTTLANRLLAVPAAAVPIIPAPAPAAIIRTTLDPDIKYTGSNGESLQDWLQLVNRKALAEGWQNADRRRAAISSLFGKAITWNEEIGINIPLWDDWLDSLRGTFEVQLTEKIRSVMMGDPPATVNAFLAELRRLEAISVSPFDSSKAMFDAGPPPSSTNNNRSLSQIVEGLTTQEPEMKYSVTTVTHLDTLHVIVLIQTPASQEQQRTRKTAKPPHRGRSGNKRAQSPQTYQPGADRMGGTLLSFNKERAPIVGEISLTVRFKDRVVDLQKVKVVDQALFPLILGVDWMGKSNVGVRLSIQDHCQMEAVIFPEISTNNSSNNIDENLTKEEVDAGNGVPSSNHPLADLATRTSRTIHDGIMRHPR
ncbi:hypothetical protein OUZ56_003320 [Daphnia magna]|uniref:Retrotransposon gag domain-containing protein n=1 Tax=Daphnia magna TaxID=35525 RepID=A0ABR0A8L2_9CRUS|nr:hypothetical protein OUZ56_003320 [Daphnia magna]